jgi:hypothetical protein
MARICAASRQVPALFAAGGRAHMTFCTPTRFGGTTAAEGCRREETHSRKSSGQNKYNDAMHGYPWVAEKLIINDYSRVLVQVKKKPKVFQTASIPKTLLPVILCAELRQSGT